MRYLCPPFGFQLDDPDQLYIAVMLRFAPTMLGSRLDRCLHQSFLPSKMNQSFSMIASPFTKL